MKGMKRTVNQNYLFVLIILTIFTANLIFTPTIPGNNQITFSFLPRQENTPPDKPSNPSPANGSTNNEISVTLSVFVYDLDNDTLDVYFYIMADNSLIGLDTVLSGSTASCTWSNLQYSATYLWYAIVNDTEATNISDIWSFTTKSSSYSPSPPSPPPQTNLIPIANITGPYVGYVNETLIFSAHYSINLDGTIVGYRWDFENDGEFDTDWLQDKLIACVYYISGEYIVKLEVKDDDGATDTDLFTITIKMIEPTKQIPIIKINNTHLIDVNQTIYFNTSGTYDPDGQIISYEWDFGDYNKSNEKDPVHTYSEPGNYIIILTVTDNDNLSTSYITTVVVRDTTLGTSEKTKEEKYYPLILWIIFAIGIILILLIISKQRRNEIDYLTKKLKDIYKIKNVKKALTTEERLRITPKTKKPSIIGKPVLLKNTNGTIGFVIKAEYDSNKKPVGYKFKHKITNQTFTLPKELFEEIDNKIVINADKFDNENEILAKLEFKDQVTPELKILLTENLIPDEEIIELFVMYDKEMVNLLQDAIKLRKLIENRLTLLKKQRIILEDQLRAFESKNTENREYKSNEIKEEIKTIDINLNKCKQLIKRLDKTSFGILNRKNLDLKLLKSKRE